MTAEIAEWIAEELRGAGLTVDVRPAAEVQDVAGYVAIVLGVAMYAAGWQQDAHQFARPCSGQPAWLFSSGPLDSSIDEAELPPTHY